MIKEAGNPEVSNRAEVVCHTCNYFRRSAALPPARMLEIEDEDLLTEGQIRTVRRLAGEHDSLFGGGHVIAIAFMVLIGGDDNG